MSLAGIPGKTFVGELDYIYPYAEARTRSIKVRLTFDNPELLLKPEMFAEVLIKSDKRVDTVVIPSEAVIRSGKNERVFVVRAPGKFEPVIVKLGIQSAGQVAVLEGIEDGDEVVVSAQFLLDSESSLREATAKMMELEKTEPDSDTEMDDKDMDSEPDNNTEMDDMDMDKSDGERTND
jgi:Cu(I)/Ag(I) efflux system membrane fusion protein